MKNKIKCTQAWIIFILRKHAIPNKVLKNNISKLYYMVIKTHGK